MLREIRASPLLLASKLYHARLMRRSNKYGDAVHGNCRARDHARSRSPNGQEASTSDVCFSNRPVEVKRFQTIHDIGGECRSRARASLRNRHIGRSIMGFVDKVEQSIGRPRQCGSEPTYELTLSIVPRGASFRHKVDLEFSSYRV